MKTANHTAPPRIGRTARAIATAGVGLGLALASAGVAAAVWDIEKYDACMKIATTTEQKDRCCIGSGGNIGNGPLNSDGSLYCVSPPAEADNVPGSTNPPPGQPRPPIAPAGAVSDDPRAGVPKPRPTVVAPGPVG